jgi:hypothetical protein
MQVVGQIITTTIDVSVVVLDNSVIHLVLISSIDFSPSLGMTKKLHLKNFQLKSMIERRAK